MYILNSVSSKKELQSVFWDDVLFKIYSYQIFFKDKKTLSYVGFIKKHPHDDYSIVRLVFTDDGQANIDNIKSLFKTCVKTGQRIFKHINESFI